MVQALRELAIRVPGSVDLVREGLAVGRLGGHGSPAPSNLVRARVRRSRRLTRLCRPRGPEDQSRRDDRDRDAAPSGIAAGPLVLESDDRSPDRLGLDHATAWHATDAVLEMLARRISHGE